MPRIRAITAIASLALPLLAVALLSAPPAAAAPPPPVALPRTEVHTRRATANGVTYRLDMSLPRSFARGGAGYPLVVVLDSDYAFPVVRAAVEHLSDRGWIPEAVIVGVGYDGEATPESYRRNRTRDYTPVPFPREATARSSRRSRAVAPRSPASSSKSSFRWPRATIAQPATGSSSATPTAASSPAASSSGTRGRSRDSSW